ncbi:MAG: hypothetical protein JSR54_07480 [Proteobacteria bacterium]|nr:hypothetical protein [Pseudomonadota bacterium]
MAAVLGGCHSEHRGTVASPPKAAAPQLTPAPGVDPAVAEVNRTMAYGVPLGSSGAPLEVRFDLAHVPAPGETFTLDVAVLPTAPAPVLRVEVSGDDGLTVTEPDGPVSFEKVQAGTVSRVQVKASSATAGTRVVHVTATLELPAGAETRSFAFPVVVGAPEAPSDAPTPAPATGKPAKR